MADCEENKFRGVLMLYKNLTVLETKLFTIILALFIALMFSLSANYIYYNEVNEISYSRDEVAALYNDMLSRGCVMPGNRIEVTDNVSVYE